MANTIHIRPCLRPCPKQNAFGLFLLLLFFSLGNYLVGFRVDDLFTLLFTHVSFNQVGALGTRERRKYQRGEGMERVVILVGFPLPGKVTVG